MNQPRKGKSSEQRQSKDTMRPVLEKIRDIIGDEKPTSAAGLCHPGLWLDKFARPGQQKIQRDEIIQVCKLTETLRNDGATMLKEARVRREENLAALAADKWAFTAETTGPFTLHLARVAVLENAGIYLHPAYGFPYIPGAALKGMAHAYACEVWLPMRSERQAAWKRICDVFGWAPSPWLRELADKHKVVAPEGECSGSVVFHDAWPLEWPTLICDILNNHHPKYYAGEGNNPPGDWEDPNPVYFLALASRIAFDFPLSWRPLAALNAQEDEESGIKLACQWLLGALEHRGAGAKTNTGYGRFRLSKAPAQYAGIKHDSDSLWRKAMDGEKFCEETFTLELVSPAFLAGANQEADDCDLRPATLRGHLRWWWRTMHAGHLDVATLKKLEDAIWGSAEKGGAVQIEVHGLGKSDPLLMPGKKIRNDRNNRDVLRPDQSFIERNGLVSASNTRDPRKTTQGILYLSYGMDEMPAGRSDERKQRQCLLPGAKWQAVITAHEVVWDLSGQANQKPPRIPADTVLRQAHNSLWLVCQFGGLGSKGRNGFGCLNDISGNTLANVILDAAEFRRKCMMLDQRQETAATPTLDNMLPARQIDTPWKNYWFVLDQLGFSIQDFAKTRKRQWVKEVLGLPRKIGLSDDDGREERNYKTLSEVVWLGQKHEFLSGREAKDMRHASPFFFHLERNADQTYSIRVAAFPSPYLPDIDTSRKILQELLEHLDKDLRKRVNDYKDKGQNTPFPPSPTLPVTGKRSAQSPANTSLPRPGERVEATLLLERTKKGGWRAQHTATGISGPIQNSADVPSDKKPGDIVTLIVKNATEGEIGFRYPTDTDKRDERSPKKK
jgi:CRISPR-associated protein Cmr6